MGPLARATAALALALALPAMTAAAHGSEERYDLPMPLSWYAAGAAATVALSLVLALLAARWGSRTAVAEAGPRQWPLPVAGLSRAAGILRGLSLALFGISLLAAFAGSADPMMNLAPTLIWIVWWVGLSIVVACCGNLWPALDPWRTLFDALDAAVRKCGRPAGLVAPWRWPSALGLWPAVLLLLAWSWLEVVYPLAAVPWRVACATLAWSLLNLGGMLCFGRDIWQRHGDVFAIYFAWLGRMAPLAAGPARHGLLLQYPGAGLIQRDAQQPGDAAGTAAFAVAMLATVLFDGVHGGPAWPAFAEALGHHGLGWPDINGYLAGSVGLLAVWLTLLAAYAATCLTTAALLPGARAGAVASRLAPTLVPIAVAQLVAHNFSNLLTQGQHALALLSDPLGRHWNLWGTAHLHANTGLMDARSTWLLALVVIVSGHVASVWLSHQAVLRMPGSAGRAAIASLPLTALMVVYTMVSLTVIAEPMVAFVPAH